MEITLNLVPAYSVQHVTLSTSDPILAGDTDEMYVYAPEGCIAILQDIAVKIPQVYPLVSGEGEGTQYVAFMGGAGDLLSLGELTQVVGSDLLFTAFNNQSGVSSAAPADPNVFANNLRQYMFNSINGFRVKYVNNTNVEQSGAREVELEVIIVNENDLNSVMNTVA